MMRLLRPSGLLLVLALWASPGPGTAFHAPLAFPSRSLQSRNGAVDLQRGGLAAGLGMQMEDLAGVVASELEHLSPVSAVVLFSAGALTSLTPCTLSTLPLAVAVVGGGKKDNVQAAVAFTAGLAATLTALGVGAAMAGKVYGILPEPWGSTLPLLTSALWVVLGLAQLEVLPLPELLSPSESASASEDFGEIGRAFVFGGTTALVKTPCGTPILGAILAVVAQRQDAVLGLWLLLFYSLGQAIPILAAGLSTANLKGLSKLQPAVAWVTPVSGSLLMGYGTYSFLERLFS